MAALLGGCAAAWPSPSCWSACPARRQHRYCRRHGGHHGPAVAAEHAARRLRTEHCHGHDLRDRHPGPDHSARPSPWCCSAIFSPAPISRRSSARCVQPADRVRRRPVCRRDCAGHAARWTVLPVPVGDGDTAAGDRAAGPDPNMSWGKLLHGLLPPLALITIVLGSILAGAATPTEAAGVGATGALLLALVPRELSRHKTAGDRRPIR
jgi:TRAP-type mannitol/chloroaromatic compound transport system permease large subunit